MTTIREVRRVCHVCGNPSVHSVLGSSSAFGSPDLDTRPPPLVRMTLPHQIERCPGCGYCAPDLSRGPTTARATVRSAEYRMLAATEEVPETARHYLCHGLVAEKEGDDLSAAWSALRAAWLADDSEDDALARRCRLLAAARFERARRQGKRISRVPGEHEALLADLHRRAGLFDAALARVEEGLEVLARAPGGPGRSPLVRRILEYERALCRAGDSACHRVEECAGGSGGRAEPDPGVAKQALEDLLTRKSPPEEVARRMGIRIEHEIPGSPAKEPPGGTKPGVHIPAGVSPSLEPGPAPGEGIPMRKGFLVPYLHAARLLGKGTDEELVRDWLAENTPRWEWEAAAATLRMFHENDATVMRVVTLLEASD